MPRILLIAAAGFLAVAAVMGSGGRPAQADEAPWCAVTDTGTGNMYWDCQFYSIEACRPHVLGGNRGFCNLNPRYRYPEQGRYKGRSHHRDQG